VQRRALLAATTAGRPALKFTQFAFADPNFYQIAGQIVANGKLTSNLQYAGLTDLLKVTFYTEE